MYTIIAGFDRTNDIPHDSIKFDESINDPLPKARLEVLDPQRQFNFLIGDEVIIYDENAPPQPLSGGASVIVPPAHNLLQKAVFLSQVWTTTGTLSGLVTINAANSITMTFSNNVLGSGGITQTILTGYVHPGQQYMLSAYLTINTALTNAQAFLQLDYLDGSGNVIGGSSVSATFSSTFTNQRIAVFGQAPTNASTAKVTLGGQTTVGGTNSGTLQWATFQFEPMYFPSTVTYPTPDCNYNQVTCFRLPDDTISRARLFAGTIDSYDLSYDGRSRTWHISIAGPGAVLENGLINSSYSQQYDDQIINNIVGSAPFSTLLALGGPNNFTPAPVVRGKLFDAVSFGDNTLREVLNQLVDGSGYSFFVDPYYELHYHPNTYLIAGWALTDGTPDNSSTFAYYDYTLTKDGTQRKRHVKVIGNRGVAPAITDNYNGNGSITIYGLTKPPVNVQSIVVAGSTIVCGIKGRDTNGVNGIQALLDTANQAVVFNTAPPSGSNNVQITYTYNAPMVIEEYAQNTETLPIAPGYMLSPYDSKVNDSNIVSLTSATQRGLSELNKWDNPLIIVKLKSKAFTPAGSLVYFTSTLDGLTNLPLVVQTVNGRYLGNSINEYEYQMGSYLPTFIDHVRNANKTMNRSTTLANNTATLQIGLALSETMYYSESITIH